MATVQRKMSDCQIALKIQSNEDAKLAQELQDEQLQDLMDPWKRAESEWNTVIQKQAVDESEKLAQALAKKEEEAEKARLQQLQEDRDLALRLSQE